MNKASNETQCKSNADATIKIDRSSASARSTGSSSHAEGQRDVYSSDYGQNHIPVLYNNRNQYNYNQDSCYYNNFY